VLGGRGTYHHAAHGGKDGSDLRPNHTMRHTKVAMPQALDMFQGRQPDQDELVLSPRAQLAVEPMDPQPWVVLDMSSGRQYADGRLGVSLCFSREGEFRMEWFNSRSKPRSVLGVVGGS